LLAHPNPKESEDEPELRLAPCVGRNAGARYLLREAEEPFRFKKKYALSWDRPKLLAFTKIRLRLGKPQAPPRRLVPGPPLQAARAVLAWFTTLVVPDLLQVY
jgi:hypothetical protein